MLAFASFWSCRGDGSTTFFTQLEWASTVMKGGTDEPQCRHRRQIGALSRQGRPLRCTVARLMIFGSFGVGVVGVATAAFRLQADGIRTWLARSVTAVVGIDEDGGIDGHRDRTRVRRATARW